jgi:hypothetical protein
MIGELVEALKLSTEQLDAMNQSASHAASWVEPKSGTTTFRVNLNYALIAKAETLVDQSEPADKAKLWDTLKSDLEAEIGRPSITNAQHGSKAEKRIERDADLAQKMLDRMLQAETLAMVKEVRL